MKTRILQTMLPAVLAGAATAQSVTVLPNSYYVSDFSYDGTYASGNLAGPYETFRWSAETGPVLLGRATLPTLGVAAGSPDISYDGTRISASITNAAGTLMTPGVWDINEGWTALENPIAPDSIQLDGDLGSAWGISGDGSTVCGFYWYGGGRARPYRWDRDAGIIPLEVNAGRSARVNAVSYDGSVAAGWEENPDGTWQPTVWRDGLKTRLADSPGGSTADAVSGDGNFIVGNAFEPDTQNRAVAIWRWDGGSYVEQRLGLLPGTPAFSGWGKAWGVSDDGAIVVGVNFYSINPGGSADGVVWTQATGLMNAMDYFALIGIDLTGIIDLRSVDTISPNGSTFAATGFEAQTGELRTVIISTAPGCAADYNGDGSLNFFDVSAFLSGFSAEEAGADLNGDGQYNFFDISAFLSAYAQGCP